MQRLISSAIQVAAIFLLSSSQVYPKIWQVGAQHNIKLPSEAAKLANNGDVINIDAGIYSGDVAIWSQHDLTLSGVGGRVILQAEGKAAERKAIWVLKGDNAHIENIEFTGAAVQDLNGAGIRFEGANLSIKNCHFHHNQMGLLTGVNPNSAIEISGSEFNDNTVDYSRYGKLGHNIYIGNIKRFTLRNSYIHDATTGHNVKSRAQQNYLLYNRITDEREGSSYLVDLPDGGQAYLIGNLFHKNASADNVAMLAFAAEHNQTAPEQQLFLVNNTFVNDRSGGLFLNNHSIATAVLINNLLIGQFAEIAGPNVQKQTVRERESRIVNSEQFDYRLTKDSSAIDQGMVPGRTPNGYSLNPNYQYRHPLAIEPRPTKQGAIDVGAYEFSGEP